MSNFYIWLLTYAVGWFVLSPLTTFLHELGHVAALLFISPHQALLALGRLEPHGAPIALPIGRLALHIWPRFFWQGWWAVVNCPLQAGLLPRSKMATVLLAGPLMTVVVMLLFLTAAYVTSERRALLDAIWFYGAYVALFQLVFTAVPMRYPRWLGAYAGTYSDGYRVLELWRSEAGVSRMLVGEMNEEM